TGLMSNGHDDGDEDEDASTRDNQILSDAQITRLLRATQDVDTEDGWSGDLYRLVVVLAATGTRFSQAVRMRVADAQIDRRRLCVPVSRKGRGGKSGSTPVPVGADVIEALLPAITGRPSDAPLLEYWRHRQVPGRRWEPFERGPWLSSSQFDRAWAAIREL